MKIDTDTDEGKAELQKLIDAATDGLKAKNAELLGDNKKIKTDMNSLKADLEAIKADKEKADEEAASKGGDVEKIKQQLSDKHKRELEAEKAKTADWEGRYNREIVDRSLGDALAKAGVVSDSLEDARIILKAKHKVEIGADGPTIDGKSVTDFVSEWSQGDSAKKYVAAPNNSGGGANGSNGGGKAVNADLSKLSPVERLTAARESQAKQ